MKRLLKILAAAILGAGLFTGAASAQSISNTGPGSTNTITNSQNCNASVTNNNNVSVSGSNNQNASSGNATNTGNTSGGNSSSGNASNNNSTSINFGINNGTAGVPCLPGTNNPGNGGGNTPNPIDNGTGGGGNVLGDSTTRIAMLPNTGESSAAIDNIAALAAIIGSVAIVSQLGSLLYQRYYA